RRQFAVGTHELKERSLTETEHIVLTARRESERGVAGGVDRRREADFVAALLPSECRIDPHTGRAQELVGRKLKADVLISLEAIHAVVTRTVLVDRHLIRHQWSGVRKSDPGGRSRVAED